MICNNSYLALGDCPAEPACRDLMYDTSCQHSVSLSLPKPGMPCIPVPWVMTLSLRIRSVTLRTLLRVRLSACGDCGGVIRDRIRSGSFGLRHFLLPVA